MNVALTKLSSKGQIVIPSEMRNGLEDGDKLLIIQNGDQLILKKVNKLDENFKEDIEFAKRTEAAFKRIKKGGGTTMEFDQFIDEMKQW